MVLDTSGLLAAIESAQKSRRAERQRNPRDFI